ncbi:hypothetical protein LOK49_LG03G01293 [Camellia lanceoleosa]|uniref:Uncharacterized protein n=1 Tax=Camellia lanceoleosa TaxID=1840588 RepID=A0ACC0I941_9ERIC|nr:hypothetical protein LOK49_LG03G01293 [Camellia lanceoleosa]
MQYWLCEHTNIVKAKHVRRFPRFLRWDVVEVISSCQSLKLADPNKFEVITEELVIWYADCDSGREGFEGGFEWDSKIVMELRQEVERLNKKLEMQSVNLVEGFESIFKVKDEECKKLVAENVEKTSVDDYGLGNQVEVEHGRDNCPTVEGGTMVESYPVASVTLVDNNEMHCPIQADDSEVVVVSPMITEGCGVVEGVNSFVRNIKGKVRKNLKLSGYEYPELKRRGRTIKNEVSVSKPMGVGCSVNLLHHEGVDVENVEEKKIFSGFGITNRNTVWKMMSEREKEVISSAYERYGDRAVMWVGRDDGNAVYFWMSDPLVRRLGVRNKLRCMRDVLKGDNEDAKFNFVKSNLHLCYGDAVHAFPHLPPWTLGVIGL